MTEHAPIYHDSHFWIAVAFFIFVALFVKFILPAVMAMLDKRAAEISNQLEQAKKLRAEAEALLAAAKIQQETTLQEAQFILAQAERDAQDIGLKAAADLEQTVARRMGQAEEKITRMQSQAVAALRAQMVNAAADVAREVVTAHMQQQPNDPAITRAIETIERSIH